MLKQVQHDIEEDDVREDDGLGWDDVKGRDAETSGARRLCRLLIFDFRMTLGRMTGLKGSGESSLIFVCFLGDEDEAVFDIDYFYFCAFF